MALVAPSILSADFSDLKNQIATVEQAGADWIHIDVMDGHFVPNLTIGPPVIKSIRKTSRLPFDVHLMITDPDSSLEAFRNAGADVLTVHVEACTHLHRTVHRIKELGAKAGVALNPATPVSSLAEILPDLDLVLIMSVNPGFGGQSFIPHSLDKLRRTAEMIRATGRDIFLEIDGGVDPSTVRSIVEAGAQVLVAGHAIFGSRNPGAALTTLRSVAHTGAA